jgi:HSP20 family protein
MTLRDAYLPSVAREPFEAQIDRIFDEAFRTLDWQPAGRQVANWAPGCNVYEDENGYCAQVALPGWDGRDVEIQIEDGVLTVKGERKVESADNGRTYHSREIGWGSFTRSFALPSYVDQDKASASFSQGLLTVQLPKREEAKPRRIMIESK